MEWEYIVWEDGKKDEAIKIVTSNGEIALNKAAQHFGYADYIDMAQEKNWDDQEGLNIVQSNEPV